MDIGLLCQGWAPDRGGIERHTRDLATGLAALGQRVHVLCLDGHAQREPYSVETRVCDGVSVRRMAYRYHDHQRLSDLVRNARAEQVVADWLTEVPSDVIHVHHLTGFGMGALQVIATRGTPLVLTLHDYWTLCPRGQLLAHDGSLCARPLPAQCGPCLDATWPHLGPDADAAAERTRTALALLEVPDRLVLPSHAAVAVFERAGIAAERCLVIEHGVDVAGLTRDVARLRRADDGRRRIGVLGSVQPSKGVLELIEALAEVDDRRLALEVHGELGLWHGDGTYAEDVRRAAARDPRVTLHGPFEPAHLAAVLAGLDAVAAPALWEEVFGLSVREARAAGLPVLVADRGGLPAVVREPGDGRILPPADREAWARALAEWSREPAPRPATRPAHSGPPRSLTAMAADHARLYKELAPHPG